VIVVAKRKKSSKSRKKSVKKVKKSKTKSKRVRKKVKTSKSVSPRPKKKKYAPLSKSFFVTSIIGFLISVLFVWDAYPSYGFAFAFVFLMMFVASLISMMRANPM